MRKNNDTIWVVAGGTGGHISPGLAIAQEWNRLGHESIFISLEQNRNYPALMHHKAQHPVYFHPAPRFPDSFLTIIKFPFLLLTALIKLHRIAGYHLPALIVSMGGYPSFPALVYARLRRIPYFLHEQNSITGKVTRMMAAKARGVFLSFPKRNPGANEIVTGNPLQESFLRYGKHGKPRRKTVLFLGGSQGAKDINQLYLHLARRKKMKGWHFTVSCGPAHYQWLREKARKDDEIIPFIEDMPAHLSRAEFVVSRSGAGGVFEIVWAAKPAIFLPYPHATDDHQKKNAEAAAAVIPALVIDIRPFEPARAAEEAENFLLTNRKSVKNFAAPEFHLDAHRRIAAILEENL